MSPNLSEAILAFLANEFHLEPAHLSGDLNFQQDLGITQAQTLDLLNRLQEALDFTLPKDNISEIETIDDLLHTVDPELEDTYA